MQEVLQAPVALEVRAVVVVRKPGHYVSETETKGRQVLEAHKVRRGRQETQVIMARTISAG